ncbi:biliverdin-producing heme oxygenase [Acidovorax sp. Be4]|uniref:Biliverdin-producing heme oxygenase n=1 Tax=Acidovorax bellezanensis TaxID=2976702 RepID=A0ABT2PHJ1_9BURK|nr:biliverdin-producing heme oxygenase [Acidovorax sp. Be4]MCT9809923.1 biliverdin-producing heme oxygenase [Acidovorax sp. Be4]
MNHHNAPPLSQRLKAETAEQHERMHALMAQGNPFADRESYAHFVSAQYLFQRDVENLFRDPAVKAAVPDLEARGREDASLADLADLGAPAPQQALVTDGVSMPAALGWLYVSEGSTLGAAFLFKEAKERLGLSETFGARNLAAYPQGRALAWRAFVASMDAPALADPAVQDQVIAGANAAYDRFGSLLEQHFSLTAAST